VLHEYPSMAQALADTVATYSVADDRLQFFATTAHDEWTAVFVSSFPHTEVLGGWLTRAQRDVQCDYLCYQWIPASPATVEPANRLLGGRRSETVEFTSKAAAVGVRLHTPIQPPASPQ
jgi:hypothetical protein